MIDFLRIPLRFVSRFAIFHGDQSSRDDSMKPLSSIVSPVNSWPVDNLCLSDDLTSAVLKIASKQVSRAYWRHLQKKRNRRARRRSRSFQTKEALVFKSRLFWCVDRHLRWIKSSTKTFLIELWQKFENNFDEIGFLLTNVSPAGSAARL